MVLGRDALYRWCANLLVRLGPTRPAAATLQAVALSRACLFEQLAHGQGEPEPGRLYLLGLARALEKPDLDAAKPLAERFGGLPAVLAESARSWG